MAIEKLAVIPKNEAMKAQNASQSGAELQAQPKKDLADKGLNGFVIWNRGEQVVGGAVAAGALALAAWPVAAGAGAWMLWNEGQIRVAKHVKEKRQENKAKETVVFDAKKSKKQYALAG